MRSSLNILAFCPTFPDGMCLIRLHHNHLQKCAAEKRTTGKEIRMFQYPFSRMCVWVVGVCSVGYMSRVLVCIWRRGDARRRREIKQHNDFANNTNNDNQERDEKVTIIQSLIHSSGEARN